jgi:TMEM175 potassium channel family protein
VADDPEVADSRPGRYRRSSTSLEFDRVVFFSDAVFAIAMTLLVVGIGIPKVAGPDLDQALRDKRQEIFSFFLSFVVIGYFWLAHHRFVAHLRAIDVRFMQINLLYLAVIAFTPFPTALVGVYSEHPVSVVIYAITLGAASFLEAALFWHSHKAHLLDREMAPDAFRYNIYASLAPVAVFAASIPVAYVGTSWALLSWLLIFPLEMLIDRTLKPPDSPDLR